METHVAAWQLDIFGGENPVVLSPPKPDPLPDPQHWSASAREQMIDALISLACDSRRGDRMPESLMDCANLLSERLRNRKIDIDDYFATLGWIMGYWHGALPYAYVCGVNGIDPETMQDVILNTPLLARDLGELKRICFGSLL
ncbi:TPA: hypothetical protein QDB15_006240 [Burkholderia vietnamiensis]|uniref:Uncharacterized protein n=1 Tax=Burkholderia vietnamiensis TaxID=60552 RepID=A0AA44XZ53_BURVI|nr:hypothetical protein [Burkholderia vietnamiensis]KVR93245.1 hypothetical protein WK29_07340 [Burkholderia vietnamiensis]KVS13927.1 hypothetical protein WK32_31460 [Burkholderia vietnamiensis]MBR8085490.1 hypothetical protein [Burkholderia vietnamiensis]MBR8191516.1 hypothetical protein [Burkholderia vietnamiensis]MCA8211946.1 hypothetical protein [Burkholderia vietnamiensis]